MLAIYHPTGVIGVFNLYVLLVPAQFCFVEGDNNVCWYGVTVINELCYRIRPARKKRPLIALSLVLFTSVDFYQRIELLRRNCKQRDVVTSLFERNAGYFFI
jgi:hypothetical protein